MGITTYIIIIILNKRPYVSIYPNDIDKVSNSQWVLNIHWKDQNREIKRIALRFEDLEQTQITSTRIHAILNEMNDR